MSTTTEQTEGDLVADIRRAAGRVRGATLYQKGDAHLAACRRDLAALQIEKAIREAVADHGLTSAQVQHLAALLREQVTA